MRSAAAYAEVALTWSAARGARELGALIAAKLFHPKQDCESTLKRMCIDIERQCLSGTPYLAAQKTPLLFGTGLLAIPVLAGSAAYAVAEVFGWPSTLEAKFPEAVGFYVIILAATVIGFGIGFLPVNPIRLLVCTAVINEIVAVPIMALMMSIVTNKAVMGRFEPGLRSRGVAGRLRP